MASRLKEDEKNEKIIRGLLKQPPNKRCINCNSLGPQYVCTNFWTFVCTNCSGIHREFTHRVKSISMAKFTSQEVAALQQGGNQRAREVHFKDFEQQVHQLPDSSNVDKLRAFIKHVYVERRYAGDRPPRGKSGEREDVPEGKNYRADSRSPPYEDSYGDRRFGDRASRKYEYDRSRYDERGYGYDERSPGQYEYDKGRYDRGYQDNRRYDDAYKRSPSIESDGSQNRRFEDRRFPETPDRRRSGEPSPNYQKDYDTNSPPPVRPVREILGDDVPTLRVGDFPRANGNRDTDTSSVRSLPETRRELRTQRTTSSSSMGSADGNSPTMQRAHSASLIDFSAEPDPSSAVQKDMAGVAPSASSSSGVQDPFVASLTTQPSAASQQDLFAASLVKEPSKVGSQDLFAASLPGQQASSTNTPGNGGWATFDFAPQSKVSVTAPVQPPAVTPVSNPGTWLAQSSVPQASSSVASTNNSWSAFSQPASTNGMTGLQSWSDILSSAASGPQGAPHATQPSVSAPHVAQSNAYASPTPQPNAYASQTAQPNAYAPQTAQSNVSAAKPPLPSSDVQKTHQSTGIALNGRKEIPVDLFKPLYPEPMQNMGVPFSSQYGTVPGAFYPSSAMPLQGSVQYPRPPSKSTNPFDTAGDLPTSHATSFPSMGSLHAALPNYSAPGTPWMTSSTPTSFQPTVAPGSYMNQVPNSMPFNMQSASTSANSRPSASFAGNDFFNTIGTSNFSSQSSLPSVGGNPFG